MWAGGRGSWFGRALCPSHQKAGSVYLGALPKPDRELEIRLCLLGPVPHVTGSRWPIKRGINLHSVEPLGIIL
jgi:hypothetical protein